MRSLLKDFKEFAVKGNMVDIAVGVIIGAAFNKVVDAMVKEVFMPPLSLLTDEVVLADKKIVLRDAVMEGDKLLSQEVAINYGNLIEAGIDFLIISFTVFIVVKGINHLRRRADDPKDKTVTTPKDLELLDRIGDLLEQQNELLGKGNRMG